MSGWAKFILVVTIISTVLLVLGIVAFVVALPDVQTAAEKAAADQGYTGDKAAQAVSFAVGTVIGAFAFSIVFEVMQCVGGFLFSLKGRWGIFCIIMSIISGVSNTYELVSSITQRSGALSIVTAAIAVVIAVLMIVACFKHRAELRR